MYKSNINLMHIYKDKEDENKTMNRFVRDNRVIICSPNETEHWFFVKFEPQWMLPKTHLYTHSTVRKTLSLEWTATVQSIIVGCF